MPPFLFRVGHILKGHCILQSHKAKMHAPAPAVNHYILKTCNLQVMTLLNPIQITMD